MEDERKLFLTEEHQLINIEGMMELENHCLATTSTIIISKKNHQWVLILVGKSVMKNTTFTEYQRVTSQITS